MTRHEEDWELLNAFADGELDEDQAAELESRLGNDPDLREELQKIRSLKLDLAALRPDSAKSNQRSRSRWIIGAATAATLTIGALLTGYSWQVQPPGLNKIAIAAHKRFSHATYLVEEGHVEKVVSTGQAFEFQAPDLTASRLFLVDVESTYDDGMDTISLHYRGLRGCRLTLVALPSNEAAQVPASEEHMTQTWAYGGYSFAIVASGMDPQLFASIARFAKATIREDLRQKRELRIAMADTYQSARPCA